MNLTSTDCVSRETRAQLDAYMSEVRRWNPRINLVGKGSLDNAGTRHVEDSVQVFDTWDGKGEHWVDLGSGGGFPGLVIAILARERAPQIRLTLVDSDQRKCTFLRHMARMLDITVDVICARVERLAPLAAHIVSARALAPLDRLLQLAAPHMTEGAVGLFSKGAKFQSEIEIARRTWQFDCHTHPSRTGSGAAILELKAVAHV